MRRREAEELMKNRPEPRERTGKIPDECRVCVAFDWDDLKCKKDECVISETCRDCPYRSKDVLFCGVCIKKIKGK